MNLNEIAEQRENVAGGFTFAAGVVVIGLIFAVSEGSIDGASTATVHDVAATATAAPPAATEYFPSGYTLNAAGPSAHIETF